MRISVLVSLLTNAWLSLSQHVCICASLCALCVFCACFVLLSFYFFVFMCTSFISISVFYAIVFLPSCLCPCTYLCPMQIKCSFDL